MPESLTYALVVLGARVGAGGGGGVGAGVGACVELGFGAGFGAGVEVEMSLNFNLALVQRSQKPQMAIRATKYSNLEPLNQDSKTMLE